MAHHKRRSRRSDSNFDLNWDNTSRERKLPIEDGPCNGKNRSGKGCKRNKGGAHGWVYKRPQYFWIRDEAGRPLRVDYSRYRYNKYGWFCSKCGKRSWGTPKEKRNLGITPEKNWQHWTIPNIQLRLAGLPCGCPDCTST